MSKIEENKNSQIQKVEFDEDKALASWKKTKEAPATLVLALKWYELYLNAYSCEDIWRVNGQKFQLGMIVDAKIRYEWDKRKETQLSNLFNNIETKVIKVKNESISLLSDLLAAAHKIWGDKVAKFLQDGDMDALAGFDPSSLKNYKEILAMLQALTTSPKDGGNKDIRLEGKVNHVHTVESPKIGSSTAKELLKFLEGDGEVIDG